MFVRSPNRFSVVAALVLSSLVWDVSGVAAQDSGFARSGVLAFGVDRVFGLMHVAITAEEGSAESTASITEISLLTGGGGASPYALPRVAFDGFVTDGVSLGVTLGVVNQSIETEIEAGTVSMTNEGPSGTGIFLGGRVGYAYMFTDVIGIWPKLGMSFFTASTEDNEGDESGLSGLALSVDAALVIAPVPHFGFTVTPLLDLGLTGSTTVTTAAGSETDVDTKITDFGLQVGLLGWL
jgi:hypothetical protein